MRQGDPGLGRAANLKRRELERAAGRHGLVLRGGFDVREEDGVPDIGPDLPARCLVLFGNAGSSIWRSFSSSPEYADGGADPLNRWSERIALDLAANWRGLALFPFGGPPYQPFLRWAKRAEGLRGSRLGMLMHPQFGLWHAYRFAIAFSEPVGDLAARAAANPPLRPVPGSALPADLPGGSLRRRALRRGSLLPLSRVQSGIPCRRACLGAGRLPGRRGLSIRGGARRVSHAAVLPFAGQAIRVNNSPPLEYGGRAVIQ